MKYFSANASVVTVRVKPDHWSNTRQSTFLAKKLVWLFGYGQYGEAERYQGTTVQLQCATIQALMERFLVGDREADVKLHTCLTTAEYRILHEVSSFIAADHEGSNAPDAYLAIDLNTGRNLVLRPR